MKTKQILIVSDPNVNEQGLTLWKNLSKNFETILVNTDERAIELANRQHFDMAVIDHTDVAIDFRKLSAVLPIFQTEIALIPYKGESICEVETKVKALFVKKRNERIKRFLILDSSTTNSWDRLPPFSVN
jgi:hypothetical protein